MKRSMKLGKCTKRVLGLILALVMAFQLPIPSLAAEDNDLDYGYSFDASPTGRALAANKYGVTVDTVARHFPSGIEDFLTDDQVISILSGNGLEIEHNGTVFSYIPDEENINPNVRAEIVDQVDLMKSHTWEPVYATLKFQCGSYTYQAKTVSITFNIEDQDKTSSSLKARAWCAIKPPNKSLLQAQSEDVITTWFNSVKRVEASKKTDSYATGTVTEYVQYAYKNLNTEWKKAYKYENI